MNRYIFITMEGETTAPKGNDVNNLQVLGITEGESASTARTNLLLENPWILEYGFSTNKIIVHQLI